jgi:hypothetical protein
MLFYSGALVEPGEVIYSIRYMMETPKWTSWNKKDKEELLFKLPVFHSIGTPISSI